MLPTLATLIGNFADNTTLRAQSSAGLNGFSVASVIQPQGRALIRFVPSSMAVDNPPDCWKPNDILVQNPGRWLILDWIEITGEENKGVIINGIVLPNTAPPNANHAISLGLNWNPLSVTQDGTSRIGWFYKNINLPQV